MKLSGKRTVTYLNPGKIEVFNLDTKGENPGHFNGDNLSGQKDRRKVIALACPSSFLFWRVHQ
jgi:hypothetical protein